MKPFFQLLLYLVLPILSPAQKVVSITIDGSINPATASYIERGIREAGAAKAECLIIFLNTPGGLVKSTRVIVGHIMASPVPVVVYVAPAGAHAGSAGVFITIAAHVAVMAPATNIGAAHPVSQGSMDTTMNAKATNDASAFIRTIAEKRNRNIEWAEEAVRNSVSITASQALELTVIDFIATDSRDLLIKLEGRQVQMGTDSVTLKTRVSGIEPIEMTFSEKLLNFLSDPNLAYILLMVGFYGLLFELYNPGAIFPGVMGVLGLILGLYGMHTMPVNYAGLALIVFGIVLFLLEIKVTSYGLLTIGGVVSLALGSVMLIKEDPSFPLMKISTTVIVSTVAVSALFFVFVIGAGLRAQKAKPVTGLEGFIGEEGIVLQALDPLGSVRVHGEIWEAESLSGRIEKGQKIRVVSMKNFRLTVERI